MKGVIYAVEFAVCVA